MHRRPSFLYRMCTIGLACVSFVFLLVLTPGPTTAEPAWELTGLTVATQELLAPASGAFFARASDVTLRSDDGGASWRPVPLPPVCADHPDARPYVTIDPADHTRMFIGGWMTHDDGSTWNDLGSWPIESGESSQLVVSPADPNLLYVAFTRSGSGTGSARFLRSRDGGESWETILTLGPSNFRQGSIILISLFQAHYSDPNVMFQSVVGITARDNQGVLRRSADQGTTLQEVLFKPARIPHRLVGGRGVAPGRFYCLLTSSEADRELYRSDDDGITWTRIAEADGQPMRVTTVEYDPSSPDRVYIHVAGAGVKRSDDGGQTWIDLGLSDQTVNDLTLGVDGKNLYAATDRGVFRLPVP